MVEKLTQKLEGNLVHCLRATMIPNLRPQSSLPYHSQHPTLLLTTKISTMSLAETFQSCIETVMLPVAITVLRSETETPHLVLTTPHHDRSKTRHNLYRGYHVCCCSFARFLLDTSAWLAVGQALPQATTAFFCSMCTVVSASIISFYAIILLARKVQSGAK